MINKKNKNEESIVNELMSKIEELENQLIQVANSNGHIIIKEFPNGKLEMNGIPFSNDSPVEYYNSANASFSELTMYRVGKEFMQREMDKMIKTHMVEIDEYKRKINNLEQDINMLQEKSKLDNDTIKMHEDSHEKLTKEFANTLLTHNNVIDSLKDDLTETTKRYEGVIAGLNEDIENWKRRYLTLNNVKLDGTIITKYGKILN